MLNKQKIEFDSILENQPFLNELNEATAVIKNDFSIVYCNKPFSSIVQFKPKEIIGKSINQVFKFESSLDFSKCFELGKKLNLREVHAYVQDNVEVSLVLGLIPLYEDEVVVGALLSIQDKTEELNVHNKYKETINQLKEEIARTKKAEVALMEFEKMANASKDAISLIARDYTYTEVNTAYLAKRHLKREDVVGKKLDNLWSLSVFETHIKPCIDKCLEGQMVNYQCWINFSGQEERYMDVSYTPYTSNYGEITHVLVVTHDVTDIKLAEMEVHKSLQEAEEAAKAKDRFLTNISHQLRTPLNGIKASSDVLAEEELSEEQKTFVDIIKKSSKDLTSAVEDLLDYSSIEKGDLVIEKISYDVYSTIKQVHENYRHNLNEEKVNFVTMVASNVPNKVIGDPSRIKQILGNFVSNALKYTQKGDVSIEVSCENVSDQIELTYKVIDTGVGIAGNKIEKLFKPFHQVDRTEKDIGTGLGLAICKQMASLMNGSVGVESVEGKGSTFWLKLYQDIPKDNEIGNKDIKLKDMKVVYISMSKDDIENNKLYFKSWGCENLFCGDLSFYLDCKDSFDAVIIHDENIGIKIEDFMLKSKEKEKEHCKYILTTVPGKRGDAARMQNIGFHAYLTFPFSPEYLNIALTKALNSNDEDIITKFVVHDLLHKKSKVLIVDDNLMNLKVASKILTKSVFEADIAKSGEEALEAVDAKRYDAILMDLRMPEMDGLECTQLIRTKGGWLDQIPIIALTADAVQGVKEECLKVRMDDFLTKPFDKKVLIETIQEWVYKKASKTK